MLKQLKVGGIAPGSWEGVPSPTGGKPAAPVALAAGLASGGADATRGDNYH